MRRKAEDPRFVHVRVPLVVFPEHLPEMDASLFLVYCALRKWVNWARGSNTFGKAYPGTAKIAKLCGLSKRQVMRQLDCLDAIGVISGTARKGRTTEYVLPDDPKSFRLERENFPRAAKVGVEATLAEVKSIQRSNIAKKAARKRSLRPPREPVYGETSTSPLRLGEGVTSASPTLDTDVISPPTSMSPTPDTDVARTCSSRTCVTEPSHGSQASPDGEVSPLTLVTPKGNCNGHRSPKETATDTNSRPLSLKRLYLIAAPKEQAQMWDDPVIASELRKAGLNEPVKAGATS